MLVVACQHHTRVAHADVWRKTAHPRKRAKLTQQELADRLGYTDQSFIALVERGKRNPTVEMVLKVSNLFHVTADQLIRDEAAYDITSS